MVSCASSRPTRTITYSGDNVALPLWAAPSQAYIIVCIGGLVEDIFYLVVVPAVLVSLGAWTYRSFRATEDHGAAGWVWQGGSMAQLVRAVFVSVVATSASLVLVIAWVAGYASRAH